MLWVKSILVLKFSWLNIGDGERDASEWWWTGIASCQLLFILSIILIMPHIN